MQSKQEFAGVAVVGAGIMGSGIAQLGCKPGTGYTTTTSAGDPPPVPVMTGLNPSSADDARPRPALLVDGQDRVPACPRIEETA